MNTEVKVGIVFLLFIALLIWFTLSVTKIGGGRGDFSIHFPQVGGLKEGDPVTYNGVRIGAVTKVAPIIEEGVPRVSVWFSVSDQLRPTVLIGPGTKVTIQKEMLGQAFMSITATGGSVVTVESARALRGEQPVGLAEALASVQQLVEENRADINRMIKSVGASMDRFGEMSSEARDLIKDNRSNIHDAIVNVGQAAAQIRDTVATNRDDIGAAIVAVRDAATQAYHAIRENRDSLKGAIDHLPKLVDSMTEAAQQVRDAVNENRSDLRATMANVRVFSDKLDSIATDVKKITEQIASGRGTVGRLVMEDTLHDKISTAADSLQSRLEEVKPVTRGFSDLRFIGGVSGGMNTRTGADGGHAYLRIEPKPWKFYQFGIGYREAPSDRIVASEDPNKLGIDFNLNLGWRFFPDNEAQRYRLTTAFGIFDSKLGAQFSAPMWDELSINLLARQSDYKRDSNDRRYEDSTVMVRSWLNYRLWDRLDLRLGYDDLAGRAGPFLGIGMEVQDNDLRNILLGSSFAR